MDNKKLLVISDTHGGRRALRAVFNWAKERVPPGDSICAAVFLGDGYDDIQEEAAVTGLSCNWVIVKGNNDYGIREAESAVFDFVNYRFFACHGHRYNISSGYHTIVSTARLNGATVALSGHSHVPHFKTNNGILLINPGSVGQPRSRIGATFAVIECAEGQKLKAEFWGISDKGEIKAVKVT